MKFAALFSLLLLSGCYLRRMDPAPLGGGNTVRPTAMTPPDLLQTTNLTAAQQALVDAGKPVPAPTDCDPNDADGNPGDDNCPTGTTSD